MSPAIYADIEKGKRFQQTRSSNTIFDSRLELDYETLEIDKMNKSDCKRLTRQLSKSEGQFKKVQSSSPDLETQTSGHKESMEAPHPGCLPWRAVQNEQGESVKPD